MISISHKDLFQNYKKIQFLKKNTKKENKKSESSRVIYAHPGIATRLYKSPREYNGARM